MCHRLYKQLVCFMRADVCFSLCECSKIGSRIVSYRMQAVPWKMFPIKCNFDKPSTNCPRGRRSFSAWDCKGKDREHEEVAVMVVHHDARPDAAQLDFSSKGFREVNYAVVLNAKVLSVATVWTCRSILHAEVPCAHTLVTWF